MVVLLHNKLSFEILLLALQEIFTQAVTLDLSFQSGDPSFEFITLLTQFLVLLTKDGLFSIFHGIRLVA